MSLTWERKSRCNFPFKWYSNQFDGIFFASTRMSVVWSMWRMYNVCYRITLHLSAQNRAKLLEKYYYRRYILCVWFLEGTHHIPAIAFEREPYKIETCYCKLKTFISLVEKKKNEQEKGKIVLLKLYKSIID